MKTASSKEKNLQKIEGQGGGGNLTGNPIKYSCKQIEFSPFITEFAGLLKVIHKKSNPLN